MEEELVSVIVPVYNSEKYLEECIQSLVNQTYKNIEIILVDDGSTDNSYKICKQYEEIDKRIIAKTKQNTGPSDTRNYGLNLAKGNYVKFVDSDDYLRIDNIEKMYKSAKKYDSDVVISSYSIINSEQKEKKINYFPLPEGKIDLKEFYKYLINKNQYFHFIWANLYKADIIKKQNIKFNSKYLIGEDLLFNLELVKNISSISYVPENIYYYRENENSISKGEDIKKTEKRIEDTLNLYVKYYEFLKIWNIDNEENRNIVEYKIIKGFNEELCKIVKTSLKLKDKINIIEKYFNDSRIEKIRKDQRYFPKGLKEQKYKYIYKNNKYLYYLYYNILKLIR